MVARLIRWLRRLGAIAALAAVTPITLSLLPAVVHGPAPSRVHPAGGAPTAREVLMPTPARLVILSRSVAVAAIAVFAAFLLALPAGFALATTRSRRADALLAPLVLWPLLAPPCVAAYAWTLLGTQHGPVGRGLRAIGWNLPLFALPASGWILANWLWPIPAFAIATAFRRLGRPAMELATLDAPPRAAFLRAALPAMSGPLAAAAAAVFLLAMQDVTIPPLMLAPTVWPADMLVEATRAASFADPTAYLLWRSWPMLALIALLSIPCWFIIRGLWRDRGELALDARVSTNPAAMRAPRAASVLATIVISLSPIAIYASEFAGSTARLMERVQRVLLLYQVEIRASLMTAAIAGLLGVAIGAAMFSPVGAPRGGKRIHGRSTARDWPRLLSSILAIALVIASLLPPVVIGRSLISLIDRPWGIPANWHWHPYDDTSLAWLLGVVARFGFAPALLMLMARTAVPAELVQAARQDGATDDQVRRYVHVRLLWRPLVAGGLLLACLSLSEVQVASMVAPPRLGGSLAVTVDQQIHFGREINVVAVSLILALPALVFSLLLSLLWSAGRSAAPRARLQ